MAPEWTHSRIAPIGHTSGSQILPSMPPSKPIDTYLFECELRGLRPATINLRRKVLTSIEATIGDLLAADHDALMVWYSKHLKRAPRTRNTYGTIAQTFYKWAVERELIPRSPARTLPVPKMARGRPRPLPIEDLLTAYQNADERITTWLTLGAYAGLRVGEMARLRREEIHDRENPPSIDVRNGKGGRDRTVIVGQIIIDLTRGRKRGRLYDVTPQRASIILSEFFRDLGMPWTAHSLRHFYGTYLYQLSGGDIRFVQEQMGHASPAITAVYAKYSTENALRTVSALDNVTTPQIAA